LTSDDQCFARSDFPAGTVCGADTAGGLGLCDGSNICKVSTIFHPNPTLTLILTLYMTPTL
jgi:hypothetical protein